METAVEPVVAPAPPPRGGVLGWSAAVLVALFAVVLAVVECFLVPLRAGTLPLPVCVLLAVAGNVLLPRLSARLSGVPPTAAIPAVLWLLVVLVLAWERPPGDLIVPGTLTGLVFLFAGAIAGAYGAASSITRAARVAGPPRG